MLRKLIVAVGPATLPSIAGAANAVLGNCNIQVLTYPGDPATMCPADCRSGPDGYRDPACWRDRVSAGIGFLREVNAPAAIDAASPVGDGWTRCIGGQYRLAAGLPTGPVCTDAGEMPHKPLDAKCLRHAGIALKPGSPPAAEAVVDREALDFKSPDGGGVRDSRRGSTAGSRRYVEWHGPVAASEARLSDHRPSSVNAHIG